MPKVVTFHQRLSFQWEIECNPEMAANLLAAGFLEPSGQTENYSEGMVGGPNRWQIIPGKEVELDTHLRELGVEVENPDLIEIKEIDPDVWELSPFRRVKNDTDFILQKFMFTAQGYAFKSNLDNVLVKPESVEPAANYLMGKGHLVRVVPLKG